MDKKSTGSANHSVGGNKMNELEFSSLPAVVVVESLGLDSFLPVSCEFPESLLPINGVPILNYMIEMLLKNGVTEIYLLAYSHKDLLMDHVEKLKTSNKKLRSLNIQIIQLGVHCNSIGDALRDLDCQVDIRDDFILIQGGLLCVADIKEVVQFHKKKRSSQTPNLSMTMIFMESPPLSTLRTRKNENLVIYDQVSNELVQWGRFDDDYSSRLSMKTLLRNSSSSYYGTSKCIIRYDLLDIGLAICSPQLLKTFCETFDYTDLFNDFVQNALSSDIKQDVIDVSIMSQYAVKITDFRTYHVAQQHVCEGWAFPLVPDYCSISGQNVQRYQGFSIFLGDNVNISPSSEIGSIVTIGKSTKIGNNCKISNSFIGENCVIGDNCIIKGCSILDNTVIGDNVELDSSFISSSVKIMNNVKVNPCCLIGSEIIIQENSKIESLSRVSRYISRSLLLEYCKNKLGDNFSHDDDEFRSSSNSPSMNLRRFKLLDETDLAKLSSLTGDGMILNGVIWPENKSVGLLNDEIMNEDVLSNIVLFDSSGNRETLCSSGSESSEDEDLDPEIIGRGRAGISTGNGSLDKSNVRKGDEEDEEEDEDSREFFEESVLLIKSGLENPVHMSNKILELKGLRFAFFKDDLDILDTCMVMVLDLINKNSEQVLVSDAGGSNNNSLRIDLNRFKGFCEKKGILELISAFNRNEDELFTSLICSKLLNFAAKKDSHLPFGSLLVTFEKLDLINQSFIPGWYDSLVGVTEAKTEDQALSILKSDFVVKYIEWLKEDEEEEDDDSDDE
ncbi:translation initiation factor EIF-2B epsilon subunit [Cryptosporidium ubiquitum]|uniref:Translation initiation factor eIF2B subunit epsilon n=1 Tax=Cryptosporidium ubiquitum TaxID=857276 RepID=A0A1J4MGV9_9CRYT|nr:translation initiation factor EIF-2B epsilon subunit [Cryptosporidium ubiquitum]OII73239.1 translation initiation factor EIF-2B epsilon subunit [Cryptosporidium ubiquitum]